MQLSCYPALLPCPPRKSRGKRHWLSVDDPTSIIADEGGWVLAYPSQQPGSQYRIRSTRRRKMPKVKVRGNQKTVREMLLVRLNEISCKEIMTR